MCFVSYEKWVQRVSELLTLAFARGQNNRRLKDLCHSCKTERGSHRHLVPASLELIHLNLISLKQFIGSDHTNSQIKYAKTIKI